MGPIWEVVGGADKGGIIVRAGQATTARQEAERLATGALVEELEQVGERMRYRLAVGAGPAGGWVSVRLKDKALLARTDRAMGHAAPAGDAAAAAGARAAGGAAAPPGPSLAEVRAVLAAARRSAPPPPEPAPGGGGAGGPRQRPGWLSAFGLEGVANFRDAAGPAGPAGAGAAGAWRCSGGRVRRGRLYRTGQWTSATSVDVARIRDEIGVRTYIDLRSESHELGGGPCYDDYPPCPSGRHADRPEGSPGDRRRVHCPFTKHLSVFQAAHALRQDEKAGGTLLDGRQREGLKWFRAMFSDEGSWKDRVQALACTTRAILFVNHDEVLRAMQVLADPANYPVAYGCVAGKDRTGILGALVLGALGVSHADILADYLATNQSAAHIGACARVSAAMWREEVRQRKPKEFERLAKTGQVSANMPSADEERRAAMASREAGDGAGNVMSDQENWAESTVSAEIMLFALRVLDEECGGVVGYLASIGFADSDLARLRQILVDAEDSQSAGQPQPIALAPVVAAANAAESPPVAEPQAGAAAAQMPAAATAAAASRF